VLAVPPLGAGHAVALGPRSGRHGPAALAPDPALQVPEEGRAEFNRGARDPHVLQAVLTVWVLPQAAAPAVAAGLLRHGASGLPLPHGQRTPLLCVRHVGRRAARLPLLADLAGDVIRFIHTFLREHWDILRHAP
jgi:hypothetical protein